MAKRKSDKFTIDQEKCLYCMMCVENCPSLALTYNKKRNKFIHDEEKCLFCGFCEYSCPRLAVDYNWEKKLRRLRGDDVIINKF